MRRRALYLGGVLILTAQLMTTAVIAEDKPADAAGKTPAVSGGPAANAAPTVSAGPAFDRAFAVSGPGHEAGAGPAGRVVERFAPPVAAPIDPSTTARPYSTSRGSLLRPCDTPGSGCRNPSPSTPQVGVPPIGPGTRPPTSAPGSSPGMTPGT